MLAESRFDQATRESNLAAMAADPLDVLVIGGGITGAAIARDAAMRGLRTAVIDKGDFGSGSSSKTTRLIDGGVKELAGKNWRAVYEGCRERRTLMHIAPHLVWPRAFVVPIHTSGALSIIKVSAGLTAYDVLALLRNTHLHRIISRRRTLRIEPNIRSAGLKAAGLYYDAQCDDARLALATIRGAHTRGALAANYVEAEDLERAGGEVCGARVTDRINGTAYAIHATTVINAAGPWSDRLRENGSEAPLVANTRGVHVVVPQTRIGNNQSITMQSPIDGRFLYIVPWGDLSYIGATEGDYGGSADNVSATADEVVYLLRSANSMFPRARLGPDDVVSTWAGVRPAPRNGADHEVVQEPSGLVSVIAGRLTTHRVVAAEAVSVAAQRIRQRDGRRIPQGASTDDEPLPGGEVKDLDVLVSALIQEGFTHNVADHIVRSVGTESAAIMRMVQEDHSLAQPVVVDHPTIRAQLLHAVRREMAVTLCDVLVRRTSIFHGVTGHAVPEAPTMVDLLGEELGWSASRKAKELAEYLHEISLAMAFRDEMQLPPAGGPATVGSD